MARSRSLQRTLDGNQGSDGDPKAKGEHNGEDGARPDVGGEDDAGGNPLDLALGLSPLSFSQESSTPASVVPLSQSSSGTWLQGGSLGGAIADRDRIIRGMEASNISAIFFSLSVATDICQPSSELLSFSVECYTRETRVCEHGLLLKL